MKARHIDLFDLAAEKHDSKFVWQYMVYDANPYITHNAFYWESFDEKEHPKMTRLFKEYKAAKAADADQDNMGRVVDTAWRNPGRSDRIWDQHSVDFERFFSVNKKEDNESPHRAIRVVMVEPIPNPKDMEGFGNLEIDDNNQYSSHLANPRLNYMPAN